MVKRNPDPLKGTVEYDISKDMCWIYDGIEWKHLTEKNFSMIREKHITLNIMLKEICRDFIEKYEPQ
jgi:hypothetical protein